MPFQDRLIPGKEVVNVVNLSRSTIWRLRRRGLFPEPIRISAGRVAWSANDIDEWITSRRAENPDWQNADGDSA